MRQQNLEAIGQETILNEMVAFELNKIMSFLDTLEHYTPKTYDRGGWNIPNVVLWLDLNITNLEED